MKTDKEIIEQIDRFIDTTSIGALVIFQYILMPMFYLMLSPLYVIGYIIKRLN